LEVGKTNYGQLVVLDEFYQSGSHVEDAIAWLEHNDKPKGTIYAEHEPSDQERFKRAGWSTEGADKSLDTGIAEVRNRFEADGNAPAKTSGGKAPPTISWNDRGKSEQEKRAERAENNPRVGLLVSEQCQNLIRELLGYKEDHVGKSAADDHCSDSLRYCVMGVAGGSTLVRREARTNV